MSWAAVAGGAISVGGSLLSGSGGGGQKTQNRLSSLVQGTAFSPIGVNMPGGGGVSFGGSGPGGGGISGTGMGIDPRTGKPIAQSAGAGFRQLGEGKNGRAIQSDIGNINLNLGDLEGARGGLANFASGLGGNLGQNNPFAGFEQLGGSLAQSGLGQAFNANQGLDLMSQLTGQQIGGSVNDISAFRQNLQDPLQAGILSSINDASLTGQQAAASHLDLLRQQAQPFEDRAFGQHQENQFLTGQRGTTGGGIQTEAFARGLGQADLSRQLAASGEGRAATQQALNQATGLGGLQDSMLGNAVNRFGQLQGLGAQLSGQRFNQGQGLFGLGQSAAGSGQAFNAGSLNNLNSSIQGLTGLTNISTVPANLALQFMQGQANTRIGQGSQIGSQSLPISNNAMTGATLGNLGSSIANSGINFGDIFSKFGGGGGGTSSKGTGNFK